MIEIVPAIDIIDGRCVRLTRGDYACKKVYEAVPADMARAFEDCGVRRIHLVDLDGAKAGGPRNLRALEAVRSAVSVELEWGGGVGGDAALRDVLSAGADCAIVGSVAALQPALFQSWISAYGGDRMILGADIRDGLVAVKGWLEDSSLGVEELLGKFTGLTQAICTDISRDGMLAGPSFELYTRLQSAFPSVCFTVSGGISGMADIEKLDSLGLRKVIVGKAIYENRITLKDIEQWSRNA